jgi:gliding motility-associated-like protein
MHQTKYYAFLALFILYLNVPLQAQVPFCTSHELLMSDSVYWQRFQAINQKIYEFSEKKYNTASKNAAIATYTLPVVIHLIVPPGTPIGQGNNLTDAQVEAGLDFLNQSFANQGVFKSADGTDMGIQFCLARRDPNGQPTNGITRNESPLVAEVTPCTPFGTNANNDAALKTLNNWDCKQYINIWLVTDLFNNNFGCGLAGYAYFPGAGCNVDGIVQESRYWITKGGTVVTSHEMGHYFSLNHTFSGACTNGNCLLDGDQVCDTPPDNSSSFAACNTNSCATDTPDLPDDNTNYMDYTSCTPPHFTAGQQVRALAGLTQGRASLLTSQGCLPVVPWDAALLGIVINGGGCNENFSPKVLLKNNGLQTINNLDIAYSLNGGASKTYKWTGNLLANATTMFFLPNQVLPIGAYTIRITLGNPNGNLDGYMSNNILEEKFNIYPVPKLTLTQVTGSHCISDATVTVTATGGTAPYLFNSPNNGFTQNDGFFNLLLAGKEQFIVTDDNKCADTLQVMIPDSCTNTAPNQFVLNSSATFLGGDCYRLTPASQSKVGSVWYSKKIDLNKNFEANFEMNLGCIDQDGADGIAFVLQPISTAIGSFGGGLGYQGVTPSLAIEFDTYQNCCGSATSTAFDNSNDPAQDHLAIMKNGVTNHLSSFNLAGPVDIIPGKNAEDCKFHKVRIVWDAKQKRITVFVDCAQRISYQGNIIASIFNNDPNVFFGFTAATGGAVNVQQICFKYVSFLDQIADQTICDGAKVQLAAPPDFVSYDWSPKTGISNPKSRNPIFSPTQTTEYVVTMTDACGFTVKDTVKLEVIKLDFKIDTSLLNPCSANPTLSLSVSDSVGASYAINGGKFFQNAAYFKNYPFEFNQSYTIYAKKGNCTVSKTLKIKPFPPLRDSLVFQQSEHCNQKGYLNIVGLGGKKPYQYRLNTNPFQPSGVFQNLGAGTYTVTIRDAQGCEVTRTIVINNLSSTLTLKIDSARLQLDCFSKEAFIAVTASGSTPYYYYALDSLKPASTIGIFRKLKSGTHQITVRDDYGCESAPLKFTVVNHINFPTFQQNVEICDNDEYIFNKHIYSKKGIYLDTLKTIYGCDSVITTNLSVNKTYDLTLKKAICEGESLKIGTSVYNVSGTYKNTLKSNRNCDSVLTTILTVYPKKFFTQKISICADVFVAVGIKKYNKTGIYKDTLKVIATGCDSILTTDLTVNPFYSNNQKITICQGQKIKIGSSIYTLSGTYKDVLKSKFGCDSLVTTILTVNPVLKLTQKKEICEKQTFTFGGHTYTQTGTYVDTLKTLKGCDSIVTTQLTVRLKGKKTITASICAGEKYGLAGKNYSSTGIFYDTLKTIYGCDSILTLNLTVRPLNNVSEKKTICENEILIVDKKRLDKSGIYQYKFKNKYACDSLYTLNLTVLDTSIFYQEYILCAGDSIRAGNKIFTKIGDYQSIMQSITGCDSTLMLHIQPGTVDFCEDKYCRMFIPNSFSPNDDKVNDYFQVFSPVASITRLQIFDRWGNLHYDESSLNPRWDGTTARGGSLLPNGVYVYVAFGTCGNGKPFIKSGDVTIAR